MKYTRLLIIPAFIIVFLPSIARACVLPNDVYHIYENGVKVADNSIVVRSYGSESKDGPYSMCGSECLIGLGEKVDFFKIRTELQPGDYYETNYDYNSSPQVNQTYQQYLIGSLINAEYVYRVDGDPGIDSNCGDERNFNLDIAKGELTFTEGNITIYPKWYQRIYQNPIYLILGALIAVTIFLFVIIRVIRKNKK